jgi:hypothetical protein
MIRRARVHSVPSSPLPSSPLCTNRTTRPGLTPIVDLVDRSWLPGASVADLLFLYVSGCIASFLDPGNTRRCFHEALNSIIIQRAQLRIHCLSRPNPPHHGPSASPKCMHCASGSYTFLHLAADKENAIKTPRRPCIAEVKLQWLLHGTTTSREAEHAYAKPAAWMA